MGIGLGLGSDMQVNHGAFQCLMAQDFLNMPYGNIGFQEVCCIGMAKDMGMNVFFDPQSLQGALQDPRSNAPFPA